MIIETTIETDFYGTDMITKIQHNSVDDSLKYLKESELYKSIEMECLGENFYGGFGFDLLDNYANIIVERFD